MQRGVTERCRHNLLCNWGQFLPRSFFTKNCRQFPSKTFQVDTFFPFLACSDVSIVFRNYFFLTIFCFSSRPRYPLWDQSLKATGCKHQNKEIRQMEGRHTSLTEKKTTVFEKTAFAILTVYFLSFQHHRYLTWKLVKYCFA